MRKTVRSKVLIAVLAGLVGLVVYDSITEPRATGSPARTATGSGVSEQRENSAQAGAERHGVKLELRDRAPFGEPREGLFSSHSWQPSISPRASSDRRTPIAPVAPPVPYRFAGALVQDGKLQVLLATGNKIVPAREGETLEGGYRIDSIGDDQITLTYLPLRKKQVIPFFSSLVPAMKREALARAESDRGSAPTAVSSAFASSDAGARQSTPRANSTLEGERKLGNQKKAQLSWRGPKQVQLGKQFSVSLRVTSSEPVGGSPMRIQVNPALQPVAVKPGRFFGEGDRNFGYRVNPDGSILVAAMSQNPVPASDAEFVVLTFLPRKATPAAELAIASLSLHDPTGRPIAFGHPEVFRTAIGP